MLYNGVISIIVITCYNYDCNVIYYIVIYSCFIYYKPKSIQPLFLGNLELSSLSEGGAHPGDSEKHPISPLDPASEHWAVTTSMWQVDWKRTPCTHETTLWLDISYQLVEVHIA